LPEFFDDRRNVHGVARLGIAIAEFHKQAARECVQVICAACLAPYNIKRRDSMKLTKAAVGGILIGVSLGIGQASAQTVLTEDTASRALALKEVEVRPEKISGVITNNTPHTVRDIELLVQYHWLWQNERDPGQNPPGRSVTVKLDGDLRPGGSLPFDFKPSTSLPVRSDGRFMPEVDIAAFTTVVPQQMR